MIEIMAPAGSWESLRAAIQARASSVYFGIGHLNMRSQSAFNFSLSDLPLVVQLCKKHKIKTYVTLNSILTDEDLPLVHEYCRAIKESGADAVIASDLAAIQAARSYDLSIHASTQLNICNREALSFFAPYVDCAVLARELTLPQIQSICEFVQKKDLRGPNGQRIQIELFAHGALCVSYAGKCAMSLALYNRSANRGECVQPCRRKYRVIDEETQNELLIDNHYVMSPKDLCTIGSLNRIIDAGVNILKIEGRGRSPEYVFTVVSTYREACDAIEKGTYTPEKIAAWQQLLKSVYNRGFWENGYYLGEKLGEWSGCAGSQATKRKKHAGKITNYFPKIQVAECLLQSGSISDGDEILITGPTTGIWQGQVTSLQKHSEALVTFPVSKKVRKNDQVYIFGKD